MGERNWAGLPSPTSEAPSEGRRRTRREKEAIRAAMLSIVEKERTRVEQKLVGCDSHIKPIRTLNRSHLMATLSCDIF